MGAFDWSSSVNYRSRSHLLPGLQFSPSYVATFLPSMIVSPPPSRPRLAAGSSRFPKAQMRHLAEAATIQIEAANRQRGSHSRAFCCSHTFDTETELGLLLGFGARMKSSGCSNTCLLDTNIATVLSRPCEPHCHRGQAHLEDAGQEMSWITGAGCRLLAYPLQFYTRPLR